jgi:hypothetical protein
MFFNSLLCSLLAAYACGASGTYEASRYED